MTSTEVINRFQLKEHLYTFELPPKRDPTPIGLIFTGLNLHTIAVQPTKFHPNPLQFVQVLKRFQLKEHLFTGQHQHTLAVSPSKFHPSPTSSTEVINRFQLKEHLYTFESPPKRDPPQI